jgi:hypothetical protein
MVKDRIKVLLALSELGLDIDKFYNVAASLSDVSLQGDMDRDSVEMITKFGITLTSASNGFLYGEFYAEGIKFRIVLT